MSRAVFTPTGLEGRRYLVTGANAGVGFFTSFGLAAAGAHVILSGRHEGRLDAALAAIRGRSPHASVERIVIDQSSRASVHDGAARLLDRGEALDGLVANAGMVHTPARRELSVDGDELVLATNVLGHFALLARVLPLLAAAGTPAEPARVVTLGSLSTRMSTFRADDLQLERGYDSWRAYAQSKIAAQALGFELARRLRAAGLPVASIVAHPGYSAGGLTPRVPGVNEPTRRKRFVDSLTAVVGQGKDRGAESILFAAAAPGAQSGEFWGPRLLLKGRPSRQTPTRTSSDPALGARVWRFAEEATGERFAIG